MSVSRMGLAEIISDEAIVTSPYFDSVGVLTDGVGHTAKAGGHDPAKLPKGVPIPIPEIIATFRKDVRKFNDRVNKAVTRKMAQHEEDAFTKFDFNTGGINRATAVTAFNAGDRAKAADLLMNWRKPPEIIPRRRREQKLLRDGVYSSGGMANVYPADTRGRVLWKRGKRINVLPIIDNLFAANAADDKAAADGKKAVGAGGGTLITGGGSTQAPDISQLPNDAGTLHLFLIAVAVVLGAIALVFIIGAIRHRLAAKANEDAAVAKVTAELEAAAEGSAPVPDHITDPDVDPASGETQE